MIDLPPDILLAIQAMVRGTATKEQLILCAKNGIGDTHKAHQVWTQIREEASQDLKLGQRGRNWRLITSLPDKPRSG